MINKNTAIVYSAHIRTKKENIGDILSAQAIAILFGLKKPNFYCLPDEIGLSSNLPVIYGGGGMIRPLFSKKENMDFVLRNEKQPHIIYGVGINVDVDGKNFSQDDIRALNKWLVTAKSVTVRDKASLKFVYDKFNFKAKLAPCPTYSILKNEKLFPVNIRVKNKIGIVPSFGHTETYANHRDEIIILINDLIDEMSPSNICIICHDEQDYDFSIDLFSKKGVSIIRPLTFKSVHRAYKSCDSIITLRGHGIIFAAATGRVCSYIPLNIKLNSLYHYHYGVEYNNINFNMKYHLDKLKKRRLPIDLNINL